MATMDIFATDAFSVIELTRSLENIPYKPATLSGSGLFTDRGVRARTVVIESRDGTLSLIPFTERGSAYDQQVPVGGLVILRDGDPGAPEVLLSPLAYSYEHKAEIEAIVQGRTTAARATAFDTLTRI